MTDGHCTEKATLGDVILIIALEANRFSRDDREAQQAIAYILSDLLVNATSEPKLWH